MSRTRVRTRVPALVAALALALTLAACGGTADDAAADDAADPVDGTTGSAAGTCLEGTEDCMDTPELEGDDPVEIDETGVQQFAADAQYYLGRDESELAETIRIGRRGDESMALTEDYVIGRMTAELDDPDGDGTFTVSSITVELPDGPETFQHDA